VIATDLRLAKMAKYIKIEEDDDFTFLFNMFERARGRIRKEVSVLDIEQSATVMRIYDALHVADSSPVQEDTVAEGSKEIPKAKNRTTKAPRTPNSVKVTRPKSDLCRDHPYYGAVKVPRHDCEGCWAAYKKMNPSLYTLKRRQFERKNSKEAS
jgi:hypothetical protein